MNTKGKSEEKFSLFRSIAWPIHRFELKQVISMLLLFGFLCTCYSILRNIKDTLILTANSSGAEVIPFIKVWGVVPGAILMTWLYAKIRAKLNREKVFYVVVGGFITYFLLFAFVIFPNSETLNLTETGNYLRAHLPPGFKGLISMVCNWTFSTFYVISELWSVLVLAILFWGFANDTTPLHQAKRCYGIFNIGSTLAPILGGGLAILVSTHLFVTENQISQEAWHHALIKLTLLVSFFGCCAMGTFYWIQRKVIAHNPMTDGHDEVIKNSKKKRLSIRECIRHILSSKYLTCLALIVVGYSIAINFTDVLWKEQLKKYFSDPVDMLNHLNQVTIGIGIVATIGSVLFSFIVRRVGWTFVALLTPLVMVLMALGFFSFLFFESSLYDFTMLFFGATPLLMTVYLGSLQNCLSKGGKYSVFDASKELAFLAIDPESRIKGKAAIDGFGSSIGKSGSSLTYQGIILTMGSIGLCSPYIAMILAVVFAAWIYSVFFVAKEFNEKSKEAALETAPAE